MLVCKIYLILLVRVYKGNESAVSFAIGVLDVDTFSYLVARWWYGGGGGGVVDHKPPMAPPFS